ncbi:hypothetical protein [Nonomuraea sp. CA-141351]|uniref:hypothetical protein n=1 Tax=Nonomuraea sp. CA-141351 TaxID=3239996 RepID=UPI003D8BB675
MEKWSPPDRRSQNRCLFQIARFFDTVPDTSFDVEIEIDGPRVIQSPNLSVALADDQARTVMLTVRPTGNGHPAGDWQIQVYAVRDVRRAEIELCAFRQVPQDVWDGLTAVVYPYCKTPKKRFPPIRLLGSWIRSHVWAKFVLPVMVIVVATGLTVWIGWKG